MPDRLEIDVLGELRVRRDGAPAALPHSKKTRALLAFLAVQRAPQRRDALCELLWELPDDPRAALRWSLTKLRPLVNGEQERLEADRERVVFHPHGAEIDLARVRAAGLDGAEHLSVEELRALAGLFRGPFLEGLDLSSQPAFTTWRLGQQEQARRLHLLVLDALAEKLTESWSERAEVLRKRVELDPGDVETHAGLIGALARAGASAEAEAQREASVRMLGAIGPFDEAALDAAAAQTRAPSAQQRRQRIAQDEPQLRQDVRFCTARDGVRIAYATVGKGPPLLKTANWLNHLEFDWESPIQRHLFRAFARAHTLVRYDSRGNGLSDWDAADLTLDAFVTDLKAVADAAGLERFPLLAMSQGVPVAVEFAVRHPERVSKLVLLGGYARGWRKRDEGETYITQQEAMITLTRTGWGRDNPAYRQLFTAAIVPDATVEQMDAFDRLQRLSTSPENAARLLEAFGDIDVRDKLPLVQAPTLVLHVRGDARIGYANGKEVAAGIPGARFVTLEGRNHLILEDDSAWPRLLEEVNAFLAT